MILDVGTDIVDIKRFKASVKKNPKILERLFTKKERERVARLSEVKKMPYYAKRFAAKEAIAKACETGIGASVNWQDIEILNDKSGNPFVVLSKEAQQFLEKKFKSKSIHVFLSLTDEKDYAMAFVILTT